jgi:8-oxo-dGTP diphosphatase
MIKVTCAIIRNEEEEILVVQRSESSDHPLKWEFPGGKLKEGETAEECIIREIMEELSLEVVIISRLADVEYNYGIKHILLMPFVCDTLDDLPVLYEHVDFKWLEPSELLNLDYSEADGIVAEDYLKNINAYEYKNVTGVVEDHTAADDEDLKTLVSGIMGRKEAEWIANSAVENPVIFRKLIDYSFSDDDKLAFRSSWILAKVCDKEPAIIYPYLSEIVETLKNLNNESAQRSLLRIISLSEMNKLSKKHHGLLTDHCFEALKSNFSSIAIKAYSMEILYKLSKIYPGLVHELSATINMLQGEGSAGIIARGRMILRKLAEITSED